MNRQHDLALDEAQADARSITHPHRRRTRILWIRVAAVAGLAAAAFLLGRSLAPRPQDDPSVERLRSELAEAHAAIATLRAEQATPTPSPTPVPPADDETPGATERPSGAVGEIYVVRPGDTLQAIAAKFYEDPTLDDVIARVNGIDDPTLIHAGLELRIPPRSEL
jgi:nucleoid-associated protein YgaU